jgi:hypothetical protein
MVVVVVVMVVVCIILSGQVRQIPNHDTTIFHTIFEDSDLGYLLIILNFLTFNICNLLYYNGVAS